MKNTKLKFKFYPDAGHGWLAVKRKLLKELNILNKITTFSYQRGQTVYLEEDCDVSLFLKTLKEKDISYEIIEPVKWPDTSPIRSYEIFMPREEEKV